MLQRLKSVGVDTERTYELPDFDPSGNDFDRNLLSEVIGRVKGDSHFETRSLNSKIEDQPRDTLRDEE